MSEPGTVEGTTVQRPEPGPASPAPAAVEPDGAEATIAAMQSHGGNAATTARIEQARALAGPVARRLLAAAAERERAGVLEYLRHGLGVGGASVFTRSRQVRQFRQRMKDAARQRAMADITAINEQGAQGPATRQYLEVVARADAYASAKKSVDEELADEAAEWMQQHWEPEIDAQLEGSFPGIVDGMVGVLLPDPADPRLIEQAAAVGGKAAARAAQQRAGTAHAAARAWKNAFIKPAADEDAQAAAETTQQARASDVADRAGADEVGGKALATAIRANTTDEGLSQLGTLIDRAVGRPGDTISLEVELTIPIPDAPGLFVLLTLEGKAARGITGFTTSGVASLGDPRRVEIMGQLSVGAGAGVEFLGLHVGASGSVGFFVRAGADEGTQATMKALSYGAYRSACGLSEQFGNWWAGGSARSSGSGSTQRSEMWAAMVEEQVFDADPGAFADFGLGVGAEAGIDAGIFAASVGASGERFQRYDKAGLEASLGEAFAQPVGSKEAAKQRRKDAAARQVRSRGISTEVSVDILGEGITFEASYSYEDAKGERNDKASNWGVEVNAAISLAPGAATAVERIAAGLVAGAASALSHLGQAVQKDGGHRTAGAVEALADGGRILDSALEGQLADGLRDAAAVGGDGAQDALSASSQLQVAITYGRSGGQTVLRFEVRETKSVGIDIGVVVGGLKIEATRGTRIFAFEHTGPAPDDPEGRGTLTVEGLGLRAPAVPL